MIDLAIYRVFYWVDSPKINSDFRWEDTEVNSITEREAQIEAIGSVTEYLRLKKIKARISHARLWFDKDNRINI